MGNKRRGGGEKDLFLLAGKMPNAPAHILEPVIPLTRIPCCHYLHVHSLHFQPHLLLFFPSISLSITSILLIYFLFCIT